MPMHSCFCLSQTLSTAMHPFSCDETYKQTGENLLSQACIIHAHNTQVAKLGWDTCAERHSHFCRL